MVRVDLVEDDAFMGEALTERLQLEGMQCRWWRSAQALVRAAAAEPPPHVLISDVRLGDGDGTELARALPETWQRVPWIYITGYGSGALRESLLARGALDFLSKPLDMDRLLRHLRAVEAQLVSGRLSVDTANSACPLGVSSEIRRLHAMVKRLGRDWSTILVTGETGAGKEELARCLHRETLGEARPFVAVNSAALPEHLIEAELFGYEKGAFTGAVRSHRGLFEQADGGTLFLDEIGDMPLGLQARLLRVMQDQQVVRLGGERARAIDVKLIFATHRNLFELVRSGRFREDLYYRINVVHLHVPPLRERPEDIGWLAQQFVSRWNTAHPARARRLDAATEAWLVSRRWPGNVRQLRNAVERACLLAQDERLTPMLFDGDDELEANAAVLGAPDRTPEPLGEALPDAFASLEHFLQAQERAYIEQALARHNWQIGVTAEALGISRKNLWQRMKRLNIR